MKDYKNAIIDEIEQRAKAALNKSPLAGHSIKNFKFFEESIGISELKRALDNEEMLELNIKSATCDKCGDHLTLRIYGDNITADSMCKV